MDGACRTGGSPPRKRNARPLFPPPLGGQCSAKKHTATTDSSLPYLSIIDHLPISIFILRNQDTGDNAGGIVPVLYVFWYTIFWGYNRPTVHFFIKISYFIEIISSQIRPLHFIHDRNR